MIEIRKTGDLFTCRAHAIVNTVNCVGVMGRGVALEFKNRYPAMFQEYAKLCRRNYIKTGKMWVWHEVPNCTCGCDFDSHELVTHRAAPCTVCDNCEGYVDSGLREYIINFPTKEDWRNPSKLEWIASGLDDLREQVTIGSLTLLKSIAMPALGCTNGQLNFQDVRALVCEKLEGLEIPIILYEPQ